MDDITRINSRLLGLLAVAILLVGSGAAHAYVTIEEVFIDLDAGDNGQLTIVGSNLGSGMNLEVLLGASDVPLTIVPDPTDTEIVVDIPDALAAGQYLLTVSTGSNPFLNDEFDLVIGAVRLPGLEGMCPCLGNVSADGVSYSNDFPAQECTLGATSTFLKGSTADGIEISIDVTTNGTCRSFFDDVGDVTFGLTPNEVAACSEILQEIAVNDGAVCVEEQ